MRSPARDDGHRAIAAASGGVKLAWVTTDEGLRHVSHYVGRPRPRATCPVCGRGVQLILGPRKAHHARHKRDSDPCPVSAPETALHFNLKCHLHARLTEAIGAGVPLLVTERCVVGNYDVSWEQRTPEHRPKNVAPHEWAGEPCIQERSRVWLEGWDEVELERRVPCAETARIPDVVLRRDGRDIAAIEVYHSHRVDNAKAADLAAGRVPWVEVLADPTLLVGEGGRAGWTLAEPLPASREGPKRRWRCPEHEAMLQRAVEEHARQREAARHKRRVCAVKVADVLHPSGKPFRNIYVVFALCTDGIAHTVTLVREKRTLLEVALDRMPKRRIWDRIDARVESDLDAVRARRGALTDCRMGWARGALAKRMLRLAAGVPFRTVPLEHTHPMRYCFDEATREWCVPDDLRDIEWDRSEDDPLEPHPAWQRRCPAQAAAPAQVGPAGPDREVRVLLPEDFGDSVHAMRQVDSVLLLDLHDLDGRIGPPRRCVATCHARDPHRVLAEDAALVEAGVERLWLTRPEHWTRRLDGLPWFPVCLDGAGEPAVRVNGGLFTLDYVTAAFANGDPEASPRKTIDRHLATRLAW